MAWPSAVAAHQTATANQYNGLLAAVQAWGGNVDAGGYTLANLAGLAVAANAVLDVSAGGFGIKGAVAIGGVDAAAQALTINTSDGQWFALAKKVSANPYLASSTNVLRMQSTDNSRALAFSLLPGQPEQITAASNTLRFFSTALAVDGDSTFAGKLTSAALTVTNAANITLGANWQNWTPTITTDQAGTTPTGVSWLAREYLRIGPIVFFSIAVTFALTSASYTYIYFTLPAVGPENGFFLASAAGFVNVPANPPFVPLRVFIQVPATLGVQPVPISAASATYSLAGFYRVA
jgi:hypothetical protein